jgi:ATP-dependent protease ClpP protease subunit
MAIILNTTGASYARSLIEAGNYDNTSPWSFSAEDGDKLLGDNGDDWTNFGRFHLGEDMSATADTKARYKYPHGKAGKVYGGALRAIRSRASQEDEKAIYNEAGTLLDLIKEKEGAGTDSRRSGVILPYKPSGKAVLQVRSQGGDAAEIDFFGIVGGSYWDDSGVTKEQFAAQLRQLPPNCKTVQMRMSSPGGDAIEGRAIANMIRQHPAQFDMNIIAEASSAASIIAMAGDTIHMAEGSIMLIHRCYTGMIGNCNDLRQLADDLETIDNEAIQTYARKTGMKAADIAALMDENRYMGAAECKQLGFCDTVDTYTTPAQLAGLRIAAMNIDRDKLRLPPIPENLRSRRSVAVAALARMKAARA